MTQTDQSSALIPQGQTKGGLEREAVLARVGGNLDLLHELVVLFREDCPKSLAEIEATIQDKDPAGLKFAAHHLSGSIGNFGATPAYQAARRLEAMGKTGDLAGAEGTFQTLVRGVRSFEIALADLARTAGKPADSPCE